MLRYLSVCSGIEAASVAWSPLGWSPWAFAEIEAFPSAVLKHRYPEVPNLGDMTRFKEWPDAAIDLLVGGTPCQSFSVAGLRKGLGDPRGNLALTFLAIAHRYRPRWVVWENVPGVLSATSHVAPDPCPPPPPMDVGCDGAEVETEDEYSAEELHAFSCLLAGFSELGYFGAYGSLDAQYFRLAQRRRRVFAVFHLGDWRRAAAVLFESESLSGHPAPRREAGARVTGTIASRTSSGGGLGTDFDCDGGLVPALTACGGTERKHGHGWGQQELGNGYAIPVHVSEVSRALTACETATGRLDPNEMEFVAHALTADGCDASEDGSGQGTPLVPIAFDTTQITHPENRSNPKPDGPSPALAPGAHPPAIAFDARQSDVIQYGEKTGPLDTDGFTMAVAFQESQSGARVGESHPTLDSNNGSRRHHGVLSSMQVRRLTPMECERLQGFPDNYTLIPYRGKPAKDGPRYKALGNSMAVPVMRWIGERIAMVEEGLTRHS